MSGVVVHPGVSREDVIWSYRLLLDRDPENDEVITAHMHAPDRGELVRNILYSTESLDRGLAHIGRERPQPESHPQKFLGDYSGYDAEDLVLFEHFDRSSIGPTPGFVTDWIGSRVRTSSLWRECAGLDGAIFGLPVPSDYHAETIEWLGTLKAVLSATDTFSVMELGAGFGPWISGSCAAARNRGITDLFVCGVEGDPGRFSLLQQNMADNGLEASARLIQAAIGVAPGSATWPLAPDPANDSGIRPIRTGNAEDADYIGRAEYRLIDVSIVALDPLLASRPYWDLLHVDIQGTEVELCSGCIEMLTDRVRYMVIGTHSRRLDGDLIAVMSSAGWVLEHEKPTEIQCKLDAPSGQITLRDGAQVWRNPKLAPFPI